MKHLSDQSGMTLFEVMMGITVASMAVVATTAVSVPWMAKENLRSATYDVQTALQMARIEAITRNRDIKFIVDTQNKVVLVVDDNGTDTAIDDTILHRSVLPKTVAFQSPDNGEAIDLATGDAFATFETHFAADGSVIDGTGGISLHGGDGFQRVAVFGAGGVQAEVWNGEGWRTTPPENADYGSPGDGNGNAYGWDDRTGTSGGVTDPNGTLTDPTSDPNATECSNSGPGSPCP